MAAEEHEGGDEGYFASVSDLMVGVLFVFLLLLTVFALNLRDEQDSQTIARERYEAALARAEVAENRARLEEERAAAAQRDAELQKTLAVAAQAEARRQQVEAEAQKAEADSQRAEADRQRKLAEAETIRNDRLRTLLREALLRMRSEVFGRQEARVRFLTSLRDELRKQGIVVEIDPESGVLRLPESLLFAQGESTLGIEKKRLDSARQAEAQAALDKLARSLATLLRCPASGSLCNGGTDLQLDGVLIEGHSDRQAFTGVSSAESRQRNDRLSVERALTVFNELLQRHELGDLRSNSGVPLLAVSAYGDRRPTGGQDLQRDRRIDLRFLLSARTGADIERLIDETQRVLDGGS